MRILRQAIGLSFHIEWEFRVYAHQKSISMETFELVIFLRINADKFVGRKMNGQTDRLVVGVAVNRCRTKPATAPDRLMPVPPSILTIDGKEEVLREWDG